MCVGEMPKSKILFCYWMLLLWKTDYIFKCSFPTISSISGQQDEEEHFLKPTPELAAEKTLPFFYGDPPPELLNTPLEDLDPYYQSKKVSAHLMIWAHYVKFDWLV